MDIFILFDLAPYAIKFVNFHAKVTLFPVYSSKEISVESLVKLLPPKLSWDVTGIVLNPMSL